MKKIYTLLCLFIPHLLLAHGVQIHGRVVDLETKQPLNQAYALIKNLQRTAYCNLQGEFHFNDIDPGEYQLEIYATNYQTESIKVSLNAHDNSMMEFFLKRNTIQLNEIKIQGSLSGNLKAYSADKILSRPLASGQEMLRLVPGLFIAQHAGGGKAEQIFLRGFDCDHGTDIAITLDGMPVNMVSHAHGQGYADLHFVMPEVIERMTINKGDYDPRIGNFATAGWISFQTKNQLEENMVKLETGRFGNYRAYTQINLFNENLRNKNQHLYIASEYLFRRNYFNNPDNLHRSNLFWKYHGLVKKHHQVSIGLSNFWSRWNASGQIPLRAVERGDMDIYGSVDPTEGGRTGRFNANIECVSDLHRGRTLTQQWFYNRYDFSLYSNFTFFKEDSIQGDKIHQQEGRNIVGYKNSYKQTHHIGTKVVLSEIGLQWRGDFTQGTKLNYVTPSNQINKPLALGDIIENNVSVYINETFEWTPSLTVNLGLRQDVFMFKYKNTLTNEMGLRTKSIFSPKLNINYKHSANTDFFLQTGKGFHSNDTRVVIANRGQQILPAAYGAEVGLNTKLLSSIRITASLWWLHLQQEFVYVGDEAVVEAGGATRRMGMDIGLRYKANSWLQASADVNYAIPRALGVESGENKIPLAPGLTSVGEVRVNPEGKWQGSIRYRYIADRPANEFNSVTAKGYFLLDGIINYTYRKMMFGISADNILNKKYFEAQFDTESKLKQEAEPSSGLHVTAGTPFYLGLHVGIRW